jgi:hypothetical protein
LFFNFGEHRLAGFFTFGFEEVYNCFYDGMLITKTIIFWVVEFDVAVDPNDALTS